MSIRHKVLDMWSGIKNFVTFAKVIYGWRVWDYSFTLEVIDKMLAECEKHWGKDTHYMGDKFTKGRIIITRKDYQRSLTTDDYIEQHELEKRFLQRFGRLLPRLWD